MQCLVELKCKESALHTTAARCGADKQPYEQARQCQVSTSMSLEACTLQLVPKLGYQVLWGLCSISAALHNTGNFRLQSSHSLPFLAYGG